MKKAVHIPQKKWNACIAVTKGIFRKYGWPPGVYGES
jgi:hypothetical protein